MNIAQHMIFIFCLVVATKSMGQGTPQEPVGALSREQKSLLKSIADDSYSKPLYFDQAVGSGSSVLKSLELDYELKTREKPSLRIGNVLLSEETFRFELVKLGNAHPQLGQVLLGDEGQKYALIISWPGPLFGAGALEMISRTGNVLWRTSLTKTDRDKWQRQLLLWQRELLAESDYKKPSFEKGIFASQVGILNVESVGGPFRNQSETFRFCLSQNEGVHSTKICSPRYGTETRGAELRMGRVPTEEHTPRVLVNNEEAPLKNTLSVTPEKSVLFFAELKGGESYDFIATPKQLQLIDISDEGKTKSLNLIGFDERPVGVTRILNPDQYGELTKALGFEATIGDSRKFWLMEVPRQSPAVFIPGVGGGIFKQNIFLENAPQDQSRPFLHVLTPKGTYGDHIALKGKKQKNSKIKSSQNSVEVDAADARYFTWDFRAKKKRAIESLVFRD